MRRVLLCAGWMCLCSFALTASAADTVINIGTISSFDSPNDLDLTGNIVYAVNNGRSDQTINGVTFLRTTDAAGSLVPVPGYSSVGPGGAFGYSTFSFSGPPAATPANYTALNTVMNEIQCCSGNGSHTYNFTVTPGQSYKVQMLFGENGNNTNTRNWDIGIEGALAVDQVYSNGAVVGGVIPNFGNNGTGTLWTVNSFLATDSTLTISLGQIGGLPFAGGDFNYVVQGFVIERLEPIPEPATIAMWTLIGLTMFGVAIYRRRRA